MAALSAGSWAEKLLEMAPRELATGSGLEVGFEGARLVLGGEAHHGRDTPRAVLHGMRYAAFVMLREAAHKVSGTTGVVPCRIRFTHEDVDVVVFRRWHAKP